jgi:hypothetical protein
MQEEYADSGSKIDLRLKSNHGYLNALLTSPIIRSISVPRDLSEIRNVRVPTPKYVCIYTTFVLNSWPPSIALLLLLLLMMLLLF